MDIHKVRKAIRKVARMEGTTEKQVVCNIEEAILEAIQTVAREGDQNALDLWSEIPCEGEHPNAYELVDFLAKKVISLSQER